MQQSFKTYMQKTYTHNELADIAQHGCESGCATTMIYYSDTVALFDQYRDDLFEIMADWMDETGQDNTNLPDYVAKRNGTFTLFANAVVWFCADLIAYEITQGEYIDEENAA